MVEITTKPIFAKGSHSTMFQQLRHEVNETVRQLEPRRKFLIIFKAILFPSLYFFSYAAALLWGNTIYILFTCYFFMGVLVVLNFLNLIHEAMHNTLAKSKTPNSWYVIFFDLLGANSYIWKIRHVWLHHNYPNIMGWDSDFEQSTVLRVFPHGYRSKMHKYQHIYLPFIYPFFIFYWLLIRDFKDFFDKKNLVWKITFIPKIEYVKLFFFKAVFIFYTLFLSMLVLHISFVQILIAFLIMMFTVSILGIIVLLPLHANTESHFPLPDENGKMPTSWFVHQLSCTNDLKEDNWFTRFFMGGFNYHIAHHLFPSVHHVYYPEVTKVIEKFAEENSLPYKKFPLITCLKNHYKLLKENAFHENISEEIL